MSGAAGHDGAEAVFARKFRLDRLTLWQGGGWVLSLRPEQITLGSMVLSVESGARNLADLGPDEAIGMGRGFALAEGLAREVLGAVRINILCLMMQDPIVHFHILPRHDRTARRHGRDWSDGDWPGPPLIRPAPTDAEVLEALAAELRAAAASRSG